MKYFILFVLFGIASGLAPLHLTTGPKEQDRYIIHFKNGMTGSKVIERIVSRFGGRILRTYAHVLNGVSVEMKSEALKRVRELEIVELVEEDGIASIESVSSWGLDRIDQKTLPLDDSYKHASGKAGSGVNVYVLDTGLNAAHEDFEGRAHISKEMDMYGGTGDDCQGHGTHCAGTVGSKTYGVAPGVDIYGVRVLKCNGAGAYSVIAAGMDWVAENHKSPAVASISIGGVISPTLNQAAIRLVAAGVTTVVAAGNENTDACLRSPASNKNVITVAASDKNDQKPTWSNYGSCVDIFAPGKGIKSTYIGSTTAVSGSSGTSMAAPHVAGAAAILLGQDSLMTPNEVKDRIIQKATNGTMSNCFGSPNRLLYIP